MFCYQCEQTAKGTGCNMAMGVCGKNPETADLQDLLVYLSEGISQYAHRAEELGKTDKEINLYIIEALFSTVTNVNFDPAKLTGIINKGISVREKAKKLYEEACKAKGKTPESLSGPAVFKFAGSQAEMVQQAANFGVQDNMRKNGNDVAGLQYLLILGLKGMAAYADHAQILGKEDPAVYAFFHKSLSYLAGNPADIGALTGMSLECGKVNLRVMELLDQANTGTYGHPVPTKVRITPVKGKAILVSGHDLKDLDALLKQTEGKGINIYTHGEMLPCHGYPGLKKYKHLVGNYGGAWQDQKKEFNEFPGSILMTTNCIQKPAETYIKRIFTTGLVAFPGVTHVTSKDFGPVIKAALEAEGFKADEPEKTILVGFGHNAVMGVAGAVVDAVKSGAVKHFFLIGGCDGAKSGRNYYTELAQKVPQDCVILTLACGKYRFNKLEFGDIGGIPRLLDMGQCNDAYSAVQIAVALSKAFNCGVNDLPLSMILSWYEQKAVVILLTLLSLGIKNIRLGPSLPAFVTPAVLNVLVQNFNIMPVSTPDEDLKAILKK